MSLCEARRARRSQAFRLRGRTSPSHMPKLQPASEARAIAARVIWPLRQPACGRNSRHGRAPAIRSMRRTAPPGDARAHRATGSSAGACGNEGDGVSFGEQRRTMGAVSRLTWSRITKNVAGTRSRASTSSNRGSHPDSGRRRSQITGAPPDPGRCHTDRSGPMLRAGTETARYGPGRRRPLPPGTATTWLIVNQESGLGAGGWGWGLQSRW